MNRVTELVMVCLIGLTICIPVLSNFFQPTFFHMHDFTHVARLTEMHQALVDGHFPVRWSKHLGFGYGLPQFNFYAPLPYYTAELFFLMGASPVLSIQLLVGVHFLISFVAMYYVVRPYFGWLAGLVAGVAFVYAPYRAVDSYVRGALGELTAISFIALSLMCILHWHATKKVHWLAWGSLALAGIVVSHNLTALIAYPFLFGLGLLMMISEGKNRRGYVAGLSLMFVIGMMLAAFYALPAYVEKDYTMVDTLTQGFSDFRQHFLYLRQFVVPNWGYGGSIFGPEDDISFELGWVQLVLTILSAGTLLWWKRQTLDQRLIVIGGWVVMITALLLTTFKTQWLWELIPMMAYIQFPWRYLSLIIVMVSMLAGIGIFVLERFHPLLGKTVAIIGVLGMVLLYKPYFQPEAYLQSPEDLYYTDSDRIAAEMSPIIPDFLPKISQPLPLIPPVTRFDIDTPDAELSVEIDRTHEFLLHIGTNRESNLDVNIMDFPGWTLYVDGEPVTHERDSRTGTMRLSLPAGTKAVVSGILHESSVRVLANTLSIIGLLILGFLLMYRGVYEKS